MKMKILVIPLIITIAVIFFVWLIYPAYSNGVDGVRENYAKLKSEQKKLNEIRSENENINNLSNQISSLPEKDVLYSFIPQEAKEEDIINSLGRLASNSGLSLFEATVNQPAKESSNVVSLDSGDSNEPVKSQIKNLQTDMKLTGSYEAIRSFLGNMAKFSRSNDFAVLEISKNISNSEVIGNPGALIVNASANFNFLPKTKLTESSVSNSVFSSQKLETKIIEDIKNQRNSSGFQLNVAQKGRNNLFQ